MSGGLHFDFFEFFRLFRPLDFLFDISLDFNFGFDTFLEMSWSLRIFFALVIYSNMDVSCNWNFMSSIGFLCSIGLCSSHV